MSDIAIIKASPEEYKSGLWTREHIRDIVEGMTRDGIVILQNTTDPKVIDKLNEKMVEEAKELRARAKRLNFGTENIQQAITLNQPEYYHDDYVANKLLMEAAKYVLGPNTIFEFFSGNTAMANSTQRQPVHPDIVAEHLHSTFYLIANIPLIDFNASTGATEVWPGTHRLRDSKYIDKTMKGISKAILDERRKTNPPIQPDIPKGSIILRDLTMWHAGMPNPSDKIRCMPALGFSAPWYHSARAGLTLPSEQLYDEIKTKVEASGLVFRGNVVSEEEYLAQIDNHDFELREEGRDNDSNDIEY